MTYSTQNPKQDRHYRKPIAPLTRKEVYILLTVHIVMILGK
jgi:hypothetical protein